MTDTTFVAVTPGQNDIMRLVLEVAQLPTDDIGQPGRTLFRYADDEGVIGYVGLEGAGDDQLLRSLVVLRSRRGQGNGRRLVELVEGVARMDGVHRLHLLTKGAAQFFCDLGYIPADRLAAPAVIAASAQFTTLCPASAAYLVKALA